MDKFSFWTVFSVVFLAEIPCIIRTMALQIRTGGVFEVVTGTLAGSAVALIVGICLAKLLSSGIPPQYTIMVQWFSGVALMVVGAMILFRCH